MLLQESKLMITLTHKAILSLAQSDTVVYNDLVG